MTTSMARLRLNSKAAQIGAAIAMATALGAGQAVQASAAGAAVNYIILLPPAQFTVATATPAAFVVFSNGFGACLAYGDGAEDCSPPGSTGHFFTHVYWVPGSYTACASSSVSPTVALTQCADVEVGGF